MGQLTLIESFEKFIQTFDESEDVWAGSIPKLDLDSKNINNLIQQLKNSEAYILKKKIGYPELTDTKTYDEYIFLSSYEIKNEVLKSLYSFIINTLLRKDILMNIISIEANTRLNLKYLLDDEYRIVRINQKINDAFEHIKNDQDFNFFLRLFIREDNTVIEANDGIYEFPRLLMNLPKYPERFNEWHQLIFKFLKDPILISIEDLSFNKKLIQLQTFHFKMEYFSELSKKMNYLSNNNYFKNDIDLHSYATLSIEDHTFLKAIEPITNHKYVDVIKMILKYEKKRSTYFFQTVYKFFTEEERDLKIINANPRLYINAVNSVYNTKMKQTTPSRVSNNYYTFFQDVIAKHLKKS
ncbi:hypothetical protein [Nonlabens sp.]|uniref:hypothetical protein n=1 Tax=Nonlabens sp. TaxID=1888209 RepID=UPI003266C2EF